MSQYNENIHIAILGPVSAGKSTLLNGLFATTYSQMKKKRTTMMPNIYQTTNNDKEVDSFETIQKKNMESNETIFKLRESGQYNQSHFKELIHKVKPIDDFIELPDKNATYKINDLPGINDQDCQIYYDYIKNNSQNIDIYLLVFDINSPLNRTDEVKILQEVSNHVKSNKNSYVHILINKCDDITFDTQDRFKFDDDENQESYDECIKSINKFMKDIMDRVTISPLRSSLLYTYRTAIYNIDLLDEKQIDNIIKEECGKSGLSDLKNLKQKKDFLKGLIEDKKKKLPSQWMKSTGYDLFQKYMKKIMNNYQQIITYHIEQDVDKILADIKKSNNNFDETVNNLEIINYRFKNLLYFANKYKIEEIIPHSINSKLGEITNLMNNYLISGINTYTGNTRDNAESFIAKISAFFSKVKNIFKTNPLSQSEEKLKIKRIELINNNLAEKFTEQDFTELYTTKMLDLGKYTQSVANTLDKNYMTFDKLLEAVKKITNSDEKFINVIINKYKSSYKSDTTFDNFLKNLELIANTTNNNLDIIWTIIECQFKNITQCIQDNYRFWIDLNSVNILQETDEVQYMISKIKQYKYQTDNILRTFDNFKEDKKNMQNLYKLITKCVGRKNKDSIDELINFTQNNSDDKKSVGKTKNVEPIETEFEDCTETQTEKSDDEKSDDCNDSDDPNTVYKKTIRNAKVRTTRRVNKGAKVSSVSK
jgi:small GTP-binding protein